MKRLQNKIKVLRLKLNELRSDLFFQSMKLNEKKLFYASLKNLNDFEDILIINYIMKK